MPNKLFDENEIFGEAGVTSTQNKDHDKEIEVKRDTDHIIGIYAKTITPLLQIDAKGKQRKMYIYEDGQSGAEPFFSANAQRGILRRLMTARQIEVAKQNDPDFDISPELFYLYAQGASLDKFPLESYVTHETEATVRKNAPILSLFGAGLSGIEGKLAVVNLTPQYDMERYYIYTDEKGNEKRRSLVIGSMTNYRADASKNADIFRKPVGITFDDIQRWAEDYARRVKEAQEAKKKEEKEEISSIQMPHEIEFMMPNVPLRGAVGNKYGFALTDVELGGLVYAMKELSRMQIGSAKRIGFGILEWEFRLGDTLLVKAECNPLCVLEKTVTATKEGEELIEKWEAWLAQNAHKMRLEEISEHEA